MTWKVEIDMGECPVTDTWIRYRFFTASEDYRPVLFNPAYPWWCTGSTENLSTTLWIIVAYLPPTELLASYWPEAINIEREGREKITFTDRFPQPDYYDPDYTGPATTNEEYLREKGVL